MGLNDEYSRDAHTYDQAYEDSDGSDDFDSQLDPEDWQDMYSDELLDAWMSLRNLLDASYIRITAKFPDFVDLVLYPGRWNSREVPSLFHVGLWNTVNQWTIVTDRVSIQNFCGWADNYIEYVE
jgi:hypothetical protein